MKIGTLLKFILAAVLLPASVYATISGTVTSGTGMGAKPISGALVKLLNGTTSGTLLDDTTTNTMGAYTLTNIGANGQKVITINQPGYNAYVAALAYNGTNITGNNISLVINNNTSTITGKVETSSNSAPIDSAIVTLSGGVLGAPVSVYTNDSGQYTFDSVGTGTGYTVSAAKSGLSTVSQANVTATWNATTTVAVIKLGNNKGKITGSIKSAATGNPAIKTGVSVVFYSNGLKVDSVGADTLGNYSDSLGAATYIIKVSAAGYRSDSDLVALDTFATVASAATKTLNAMLTTATASLGGTVTVGTTLPATVVKNAKLYLQRRATNVGAGATVYWVVDSSMTDANGIYDFINMIAGTTTNYRVNVSGTGYIDTTSSATTVAAGAAVALNINLMIPAAISSLTPTSEHPVRFISMGDQLVLNLGQATTMSRRVSIFNLQGGLQFQASVPAGESRLIVPAKYSPGNGFLFQIR